MTTGHKAINERGLWEVRSFFAESKPITAPSEHVATFLRTWKPSSLIASIVASISARLPWPRSTSDFGRWRPHKVVLRSRPTTSTWTRRSRTATCIFVLRTSMTNPLRRIGRAGSLSFSATCRFVLNSFPENRRGFFEHRGQRGCGARYAAIERTSDRQGNGVGRFSAVREFDGMRVMK